MRAIWKGDSDPFELINGKEYEILGSAWDDTMFDVVDETGDNFLYPAEDFEIVGEEDVAQ